MKVEPYRWHLSGSFAAHLWKAATQQHHRALLPLIEQLLPRDAVVFDVGAHAGQYAKLFARAAPQGRVYAFEPGSYARAILRAALCLNRIGNVEIVPAALGDRGGVAVLNIPVKASGARGFGLSHFGAPQARWDRVAREIVPQTTLDDTVAALALDRLDFIKADIEGWELRMLHGARDTLARLRPVLMLELSGEHLARAGDTLDAAFALLAEHGYRAFALGPDHRLRPADARRDGDYWFLPEEDGRGFS